MSYPLPNKTAAILRDHAASISNLGLYLTRYTPRDDSQRISEEEKKLRTVPKILEQNRQLLQDYTARWTAQVAGISGVQQFTAVAQSRCVVGLGAKGTREVGLTLHSIYGFPLIPGSGLKGLTRTFATLTAATKLAAQLGLKISDILAILECDAQAIKTHAAHRQTVVVAMADVTRCCGAQEGAGTVCFFDAVPDGVVQIDLDIMNPHHRDYYDQHGVGTPPADYTSPIPVYFLTVAKDTRFRFAVAPRRAPKDSADDVQQTIAWLQSGLAELGVGGKTTSGYGMFGEFNPPA